MAFCRKCGAELAPDVQFCPRCGTAVAAAAPPTIPPPTIPPQATAHPRTAAPAAATVPQRVERRGGAWWIVPLVIVGLVVIAWLLLAGLPFGRDDERRADAPAVETIAEGTAPPAEPQQTGTIVDVTEDAPVTAPPMNTATTPITTTTAPVTAPTTTTPAPMPPRQADPEPVGVPAQPPVTRPQPAPTPAPVRTTPAPAPVRTTPAPTPAPAAGREISEDEATNVLRGFITSRNYYEGVSPGCVQVRGSGYRNVGYGFSVWDSCVSGGGSRMLGRWRVDAKTREVFRQREDGRYLRP